MGVGQEERALAHVSEGGGGTTSQLRHGRKQHLAARSLPLPTCALLATGAAMVLNRLRLQNRGGARRAGANEQRRGSACTAAGASVARVWQAARRAATPPDPCMRQVQEWAGHRGTKGGAKQRAHRLPCTFAAAAAAPAARPLPTNPAPAGAGRTPSGRAAPKLARRAGLGGPRRGTHRSLTHWAAWGLPGATEPLQPPSRCVRDTPSAAPSEG